MGGTSSSSCRSALLRFHQPRIHAFLIFEQLFVRAALGNLTGGEHVHVVHQLTHLLYLHNCGAHKKIKGSDREQGEKRTIRSVNEPDTAATGSLHWLSRFN